MHKYLQIKIEFIVLKPLERGKKKNLLNPKKATRDKDITK